MNDNVENLQGSVLNDAAQAPVDSNLTNTTPLSAMLEEAQQPEREAEPVQSHDGETPPAKEPGWIKGRVNAAVAKAVDKAIAETEARMAAKYAAELAPLRESVLTREAQDLVDSGEFKSLDRAKEYLRLKSGVPAAEMPQPEPEPQQPQRDATGRFKKSESEVDPIYQERARVLEKQATKIQARYGIDMMQLFNQADPADQAAMANGDVDFYDVLDAMNAESQRRIPSPMRSPNGSGFETSSVSAMSDAQFRRLNERLAQGAVFDTRR